ncbi:uncharacterized protein PFL1_04367 [Pseudozyma flocculosa PF-1]|uniref:ketol-acid reductoisomerase (NADP(+)) n=1 Tax=Pseudozyma flocculosa PF-1 TaxID=1277687 RepID=A0A061H7S2_9BASI|nr:uncharacterized protein PFL1_04367 [Pseudozyma flocculosa PF-1]EPQ28040.1 hypothetical protein PFL1_04367 [Pseudozyma flocculosa PF-1]
MNANVARTALRAASRGVARRATAGSARSLSLAATATRPALAKMTAAPAASRGLKTIEFTQGIPEKVYEREDWPIEKLQQYFKDETFAILGYGSQGHGQGLNMRDNGLNVIVGVRKGGKSWEEAIEDGWQPGKNLFTIEEAAAKATTAMLLLSDAACTSVYNSVKDKMPNCKTLYFSHGFQVSYASETGFEAPKDKDIILCAPKGSGRTVRSLFLESRGINGSIAVHQDVSGKALEKATAMGVAVGCGYLYETTFEREVYSDLYGERGCLMGGIQGMFKAQYDVLRANGHSPSEAFNETCEEALMSLFPLVGEHGMDYMYKACSTTARRGALDWAPEFEKACKPVFERLYESVRNGSETRRALEFGNRKTYREDFDKETDAIAAQEMWVVGHKVRALRPERAAKGL